MKDESGINNEDFWAAQEFWHSYNLQQLSPEQFVSVVGRILTRETRLVGPRRDANPGGTNAIRDQF